MLIMNVFEEDVVKFERSKGMNSSSRGSRANKNDDPNEESGGSDDEPSVAPPAKKVSDGILYTPLCRLQTLTGYLAETISRQKHYDFFAGSE